jgi:Ca2+-binding RTX toxin-like protein
MLQEFKTNEVNKNMGTTGTEVVISNFGNDTIIATTQTVGVEVYTDGGNDTITGSAFGDLIFAGSGNDTVNAGNGNDVVVADTGVDNVNAGDGDDTVYADNTDTIQGGVGRDALFITDSANPAGLNINTATAGFEFVIDVTAAGGNDTINGATATAGLEAYGQGGTDTITGGSGIDFLWGGTGNDIIVGGANNDTLVGEAGADTLTGGLGVDNLYGNAGGGADGALDTYRFGDNWGTDFVFDWENGTDRLDLRDVTGLTLFSQLVITADGPHAHVRFGANLISVANAAGLMDASDFIIN